MLRPALTTKALANLARNRFILSSPFHVVGARLPSVSPPTNSIISPGGLGALPIEMGIALSRSSIGPVAKAGEIGLIVAVEIRWRSLDELLDQVALVYSPVHDALAVGAVVRVGGVLVVDVALITDVDEPEDVADLVVRHRFHELVRSDGHGREALDLGAEHQHRGGAEGEPEHVGIAARAAVDAKRLHRCGEPPRVGAPPAACRDDV